MMQADFTLCNARTLLHSHAYGSDRREPAMATPEQYSAFCSHMQTVENTAMDLELLGNGLQLLINLLEDGKRANVDPFISKALHGLLMPISTDLERHAAALRAAVTSDLQ